MWEGIKKVFGFHGVGETTLSIVNKLAGTDWTPDQQAKFIIDHANATKHQSPTRRIIAIGLFLEWALFGTAWLVATAFFRLGDYSGAGLFASDISTFMESNLNIAFNLILAFYFVIGVKK